MNIEHAKIANYKLEPEVLADIHTTLDRGKKLLNEADRHYWPLESLVSRKSLVSAYAIACVEIVLLHSDKANTIYHEIVQTWGFHGCQNILIATLPYVVVAILDDNEGINVLDSWLLSDKFQQMFKEQDLQHLLELINDLVLVGFNRNLDQDNKNWKVTPESSCYLLPFAIGLRSLSEHENIGLKDLVEAFVEDIDFEIPQKPTTRKERLLIKLFNKHDWALRHDKTLLNNAGKWYKCRVNPGSIEGYLQELADLDLIGQQPKYPDQGRISNDIAPFDEATGYPRHK